MAAFMQLLLSMASRNCGKMTAGVDIPTQTGFLLAKPLSACPGSLELVGVRGVERPGGKVGGCEAKMYV
jgi:hypothetical protein